MGGRPVDPVRGPPSFPPLPAASRKRNRRSAAMTTMTPPSTTASHAMMRWLMLWSKGESCTPHLPCHCLLHFARLSPQVLPERLLVLVLCVHVPMPRSRADGLWHDAVRTRIVVESAAVVTPQPSPQDHCQVLHQDHQSVPTVLAPDGYCHGQGQHRTMPPLIYRFNHRLDYLVEDIVCALSHQTASLAVLLRLCCCHPPPPIVAVDVGSHALQASSGGTARPGTIGCSTSSRSPVRGRDHACSGLGGGGRR